MNPHKIFIPFVSNGQPKPSPTKFPPEPIIYLSFAQWGKINYDKLSTIVSAVMIRAGQNTWEDPLFRQHYAGVLAAKIPFGIWWFLQPNYPSDPQVDAFLTIWRGLPIKPSVIALDVEEIDYQDSDGSYKKIFPPSRLYSHNSILNWTTRVRAATGGKIGVYTRKNYFEEWTYANPEWDNIWWWIAAWYIYTGKVPPLLPYDAETYKIHQYEGGGYNYTEAITQATTCKEYFNGTHAECLDFFNIQF